jgi:hypothetical protein
VCNVVYAHLIAGADQKERAEFDKNLNTPTGSWADTQRRFFTLLEGG